jgi:hypothetical protein
MNNKHPKFSEYKTALQWLCDQKDAPEAAKKDALQAIKAYDRAVTLYNSEQKSRAQMVDDQKEWQRRALADLLTDLNGSGAVKTVSYVERCNQADALVELGNQTVTLASGALRRLTSSVELGCLVAHEVALRTWIAQRRTNEMHACGYTESLTTHLEVIYNHIRPQWWGSEWRAPLELHTAEHLPIIYYEHWPVQHRASLAYVWQEFAKGEVTHHALTDNLKRYSLNRRVYELPIAPASINEPQPLKMNW